MTTSAHAGGLCQAMVCRDIKPLWYVAAVEGENVGGELEESQRKGKWREAGEKGEKRDKLSVARCLKTQAYFGGLLFDMENNKPREKRHVST